MGRGLARHEDGVVAMAPIGISGLLLGLFLALAGAGPVVAQQTTTPVDRAATGGAQTLADIMARQQGLAVDDAFRRSATGNPDAAAAATDPLGTLGGVADAELWRALRFGSAEVTVSSRSPAAQVVIQDGGMRWLKFRAGPLASYGGWLLVGVVGVLSLFFLLRGRIRIEGARSGVTMQRFSALERFAHWVTAGSFVVLATSGLTLLFGRRALIPLLGQDAYATMAIGGKWLHNNVGWAFMLGLILITVLWIAHNIPDRHDLKWLAVGGGLFRKGVHPPARKFNAGQKLIFWAVVVLGGLSAVSGLSLLFPFRLSLFGAAFDLLNATGLPHLLGLADLPGTLLPQQEMQLAQLWHGIIAFGFIAVILGHIYLGSLGMEGAFDAMGSGQVDVQWAREHHGLWVDEVTAAKAAAAPAAPAAE